MRSVVAESFELWRSQRGVREQTSCPRADNLLAAVNVLTRTHTDTHTTQSPAEDFVLTLINLCLTQTFLPTS